MNKYNKKRNGTIKGIIVILVVKVCLSTHFNWAVILKCQKRFHNEHFSFFAFDAQTRNLTYKKISAILRWQRYLRQFSNDTAFLQLFTLYAIDYHLDDNWVRTAFRYTIKFEHLWYRGRACMHACTHRVKCHFTDWFGSLEMHDMNSRIY